MEKKILTVILAVCVIINAMTRSTLAGNDKSSTRLYCCSGNFM